MNKGAYAHGTLPGIGALFTAVERLKEENEHLKEEQREWQDVADQGWHAAGEETKKVEKLEAKLQDALNTLDKIVDYGDGCAVDMAMEAIQRIQEGKQS